MKIIPFSCVDGPGSSSGSVFGRAGICAAKTVTIRGRWGRCNDCGECVPQCPHQALQIVDGKRSWNAVVCEQCDTCLKTCRHATPMA
ncbi:4Fe-4S dicluster domain-containing protein [Shigella flexneri]